ncbi:MAG TPA: transporter substrate-binding domain-containing protein [Vicinamibacterales bacterium]|jgi:polar amino acid transport system substrate-binding protein
MKGGRSGVAGQAVLRQVIALSVVVAALVIALHAQSKLLAPTGTLRASFIATNPVQGRVDAKMGATSGPATDLTRELARRIGVPYVVMPLPDAGSVLDSVKNGQVDIGFLAVEAERATQVDFSDAYSSSGAAYAVPTTSAFQKSSDVDRAGVTIGAITGQAPEVYVREHVKNARVQSLPAVPPNAEMGKMLLDGKVDAFAANRTRMEELVRAVPGLRVLPDDYMVTLQAIVVPKGKSAQLAEVNRFLADVRKSGFVRASLDKAKVAGVKVAPEPAR